MGDCCSSEQAPPPRGKRMEKPTTRQRRPSGAPAPPLPAVVKGTVPEKPQGGGLFTNIQQGIVTMLSEAKGDEQVLGTVLIVDEGTLSLLEPMVRVNDLTKAGIPLIEKLSKDKIRQPLPKMHAVYVVQPTTESANLIKADWDANPKMYNSCSIFCTKEVSGTFTAELQASTRLRRKMNKILQVNLDIVCNSEQSYVLHSEFQKPDPSNDEWTSLERLFGGSVPALASAVSANSIAMGVLSVFSYLGDRPQIRYQSGSRVADLVSSCIANRIESVLGKGSSENERSATRSTILVLDRSIDVITPLLHHFTYESMLHDFLPINDEMEVYEKYESVLAVRYKDPTKQTIFNAENAAWLEYKSQHVDALRPKVATELKDVIKNSAVTKIHPEVRKNKEVTLQQLGDGIRDLPAFQLKVKTLNLHLEMLILLREQMESEHVVDIALAEQNFTTGEIANTEEHSVTPITRKQAWGQLRDILTISSGGDGLLLSKLRIVLIFTITQAGLSAGERAEINKLLKKHHSNVLKKDFSIVPILNGMSQLGVDASLHTAPDSEETSRPWFRKLADKAKYKIKDIKGQNNNSQAKKKLGKEKLAIDDANEVYLLSRAVPRLKGIMNAALEGELNDTQFPFRGSGLAPTAKTGKSLRLRTDSSDSGELLGPRLHIFVCGGVTPAEIQIAAQLQRETRREIVIGGTELLTASGMVAALPLLKE